MQQYKLSFKKLLRSLINCIFITLTIFRNSFNFISLKSCPCSPVGTCSQGWVAFQSSCYQMGKESKPWKVAQQTCETSSQGAHLLDIGSEEEHGFVSSYLQKISRIIMLWTGLNDLKVSISYHLCYYRYGSRRILKQRSQSF
uniref:C-type lectin domain-containing protein n=1 Tax=Zonotrichia albicollis TaxID=44394 RepID=A0A8D2MUS7_ZONAL